ncbi:hypothetical protein GGR52DRAFT_587294 [Hypoxylon sp. FL1284]|nr:hypothetical protein GGR52DRAFT_587294 [Hypoxylon sp. FL1284]
MDHAVNIPANPVAGPAAGPDSGTAAERTADTTAGLAIPDAAAVLAPNRPFPDLYSALPGELKLKVWKGVSMVNGVQHFRLKMTRIPPYFFQQDVIVRPIAKSVDSSAWRVRNSLKWLDGYAWDVLGKKIEAKGNTRLFWPRDFQTPNATLTLREGQDIAIADLDNDLICFEPEGIPMHTWHFPIRSWQEFRGVTRVGVNFQVRQRGHIRSPGCPCIDVQHTTIEACPEMLNCFFSYFSDLKTFYILYKLSQLTLARRYIEEGTEEYERAMSTGEIPGPHKRELLKIYMTHFEKVAKESNLEIFEDKKYTYIEVTKDDGWVRFNQHGMWTITEDLEDVHEELEANNESYLIRNPKIKVLVYADI